MRRAVLAATLLLAGCARHQPEPELPAEAWTVGGWPVTLAAAQQAVMEGRFTEADHELASFADRARGTAPAHETSYWRALYLLDPANPGRDPGQAIAHLDHYVGDPKRLLQHYAEALVLRRVASTLDSLHRIETVALRPDSAATPLPREREAELTKQNQQLREQLERTNAELERIKRRLGEQP